MSYQICYIRIKIRASRAHNIKKEFSSSVPLISYWDGKILRLFISETIYRIHINALGKNTSQLLVVPTFQSIKGKAITSALNETWESCRLQTTSLYFIH